MHWHASLVQLIHDAEGLNQVCQPTLRAGLIQEDELTRRERHFVVYRACIQGRVNAVRHDMDDGWVDVPDFLHLLGVPFRDASNCVHLEHAAEH